MEIVDILNNLVCRNHLLSFLGVNDFLRLRRVSSSLKIATEDFIRTKKIQNAQPLEIDFTKDTPSFLEDFFRLEAFSDALPQRTSVVLRNFTVSGQCSENKYMLQRFLETSWTTNVTSLSLHGLVAPLYTERWLKVIDSIPNVTSLELACLLHYTTSFDKDEEEALSRSPAPREIQIPTCLKNLKRLELSEVWDLPYQATERSFFGFFVKLVETCISNLEILSLPFEDFRKHWRVNKEDVMNLASNCLFLSKSDLKLKNMTGSFIAELLKSDNRTPEMGTVQDMTKQINDKVVSIRNLERMSFLLELPNLETIFLRDQETQDPVCAKVWPKLKKMQVHILSTDNREYPGAEFTQMWDFLFVGITRKSLVELKISWGRISPTQGSAYARALNMVSSCPNLKILSLYQCKNLVNLPELWRGLSKLEQLTIDCTVVGDADFVGDDPSNPAFWNLKRLKSFYLAFCDETKVTDDLFSQVLCHMPLKKLSIRSYQKEVLVTLDGIKGLLKGQFANTIEQFSLYFNAFPFKDQRRIENMFRSSMYY